MGFGFLIVKTGMADEAFPIVGAKVVIKDNDGNVLFTQTTDSLGQTEPARLYAPDKALSLDQNYTGIPYSTYNVEISAPGFVTKKIHGVQIFDTIQAVEEVELNLPTNGETEENIYIPPHKQLLRVAQAPANSPPVTQVQKRVFIPENITVHLGRPNVAARNVRVPFAYYIKNVASSEIFPNWPIASLEANIRAIINFALNRIYTEWYRTRGFSFDITSSTAVDMFFVPDRDIFGSISVIVDDILGEYLRRPNNNEPFMTEFCDGRQVSCRGMSQWGTVTLAEQGRNALQILRNFYPNDLMIDTAPVANISESFPGVNLSIGTRGPDVERMQRNLNRIRQNFPAIPVISPVDGIYGNSTANAVRTFQRVNNLPQTGVIDRATWNTINRIFTSVTRLAQLTSEGDRIVTGTVPPNTIIRQDSRGGLVTRLQFMINYISQFYPEIPTLSVDGVFGPITGGAVAAFQNRFGLTPDGVVGPQTWGELYQVYTRLRGLVPPSGDVLPPVTPPPPPVTPPFPGTLLRQGSRGENVRTVQRLLNCVRANHPSITQLVEDGIFGPITNGAVREFQRIFGLAVDGIVGPITWGELTRQCGSTAPPPPTAPPFPGTLLRQGSRGEDVRTVQTFINRLADRDSSVPRLVVDGIFGPLTRASVVAAQRALGLNPDGIVGPITWGALVR